MKPNPFFYRFLPLVVFVLVGINATAQPVDSFDPAWFQPDQTWIKLAVTQNSIYEVDVAELISFGLPERFVDARNLHVFRKGKEIPLEIVQQDDGPLKSGDKIHFVGLRATGKDELWAYRLGSKDVQASDHFSLYADTVHYWMTWNNQPGLRFQTDFATSAGPLYIGFRDTVRLEKDSTNYYEGFDELIEMSVYTESEGFYWVPMNLTGRAQQFYNFVTQPMTDLLWRLDSAITFQARFHGLSSSQTSAVKRANLEIFRDLPDGSGTDFFPVASEEWSTQRGRLLTGQLPPFTLADTASMQMRVRLENRSQNQNGVNLVHFDWVEYSFFRGFLIPDQARLMAFYNRPDGLRAIQMKNIKKEDRLRVFVPEQGVIFEPPVDTVSQTAAFYNTRASSQNLLHIANRDEAYSRVAGISRFELRDNLLSSDNRGEFLILTTSMLREAATEYGRFRQQATGMEPRIVEVDQVFDLFDHGQQRPIAIRRFMHHALANWDVPPKYLFIIGDATDQFYGTRIRAFDVPSFGIPSSDDWFVMGRNGPSDWNPAIPVGRLTARTVTDVRFYQNKVRTYETQRQYAPWRKRVILLSGGNTDSERAQLKRFNGQYGFKAWNSSVAADTVIVAKESNDPLGQVPRDDLKEFLDDGALFLHFFGHSAPNSWDLLTDDPNTINNANQHFVVLSLGCYSGRFGSSEERIISEQFIYADNAAVAYIGGSGAGQIPALNRYADRFYSGVFDDTLKVLGDIIRNTKSQLAATQTGIFMDESMLQNSLLMGDPTIRLIYPTKPDYLFADNPLQFSPDPTNIADSTLNVAAKLVNWGTRSTLPVEIEIQHTRPSRERESFFVPVPVFENETKVEFEVDLDDDDAGLHEFEFFIDRDRSINEFTTANNGFQSVRVIFSTGVDIIRPFNHAIFNRLEPEFIVSSPTIANRERVQFQLDTTTTFLAPLADEVLLGEAINLTWKPNLVLENEQNYWWRARIVDRDGVPVTNWRQAAFFVDTASEGTWWFQNPKNYPENTTSLSVELDANKEFSFTPVSLPVSSATSNWNTGSTNNQFSASTRVNGIEFGRRIVSFHVLAMSGSRGSVLLNKQYTIHPGQYVVGIVNQQAATNEFIRDMQALSDGDIVITRVRHVQQIFPSSILFVDTRISEAFNSIGGFKAGSGVSGNQSSQLDTGSGYILFGKKGVSSPDEISEYIIRENGIFEADTTYQFNNPDGSMTSTLIGPARSWGSLAFESDLKNLLNELSVEVWGLPTLTGEPQILAKTDRFEDGIQQLSLASVVDADEFPYVQLRMIIADSSRSATPQMPFWKASFEPVPELALDAFRVSTRADTVEEGFPFDLEIAVNNIGVTDADTVLVTFFDRFGNQTLEPVGRDTLFGLAAGTSKETGVQIETIGRLGLHELLVQISSERPDQFAYNNFYEHNYYVRSDSTRPIVEVFIDNRFFPPQFEPIFDVSDPTLQTVGVTPIIDISWTDNNPFLRLKDPSLVELEFNGQRFTSGHPALSFSEAPDGKENRAFASFTPTISPNPDSVYQLTVFVRDPTNNLGETREGYKVSFKVTDQVGITSFYPYPNPMTNFTYFAFELLAPDLSELERLKVTVFTLSGRPVKIFDLMGDDQFLLEGGGLRVGWNKFQWNGRDEDGDRLANGVYLYRVDFKAGGRGISVNNSRSVEKLVIIR